mgnify:CR=1 FL=1
MCRFTFYMGEEITVADLVTRPANSLINQSTHAKERREPLNGDGFGLAWYLVDEPVPARFRSITPAWNNANLVELARAARSACILAHVRAASVGPLSISEGNCHPFRCGPFALMHNGHIGGFDRIRRPLLESLSDASFETIMGTTDSEHLFALALERLHGHESESTRERLGEALVGAVSDVIGLMRTHAPDCHAYLNLVLTDGSHAAACRYSTDPDHIDSLYINEGGRYLCEDGVCYMGTDDAAERSVLISSEPLNEGPLWQAITPAHLVLVDADRSVSLQALDLDT